MPTISNDDWCYKCRKFFENCKEVAQRVGIVVVDGLYQTRITLQCEKKKHTIKISYTKKLHTLSCADCRKEEREEWKEQLKQEEALRNELYQRKQRELFEQARIEMEKSKDSDCADSSSYQGSSSSSSQRGNQSFNYYAYLEEQINNQAKRMTIEYLRSKGICNKGGNNS